MREERRGEERREEKRREEKRREEKSFDTKCQMKDVNSEETQTASIMTNRQKDERICVIESNVSLNVKVMSTEVD